MRWIQDLTEKFKKEGKEVNADTITEFAWETLNGKKVIPGYGHAVLRKTDPRYLCVCVCVCVFVCVCARARVRARVLIWTRRIAGEAGGAAPREAAGEAGGTAGGREAAQVTGLPLIISNILEKERIKKMRKKGRESD